MTRNYGQQGGAQQQSLFSVILTPVILLVLVVGMLIYNLVGLIGVLVKGGNINYDEKVVNTYLDNAYNKAFENVTAKDSGITICFFYDKDDKSLRFETRGGDNIRPEAKALLKPDGKLGSAIQEYLKKEENRSNFAGCLSNAFYVVTDEITKLKLTNSFTYVRDYGNMPDPFVSLVELNSETKETFIEQDKAGDIENALMYLKSYTGITVNVTVDTSEHAFGRNVPMMDVLMVVLLLAIAGLCTFNLVKKIRTFNRIKNDFGTQEPNRIHVNARSPYYDEDDEEEAEEYETVDEAAEEDEEAEAEETKEETEE